MISFLILFRIIGFTQNETFCAVSDMYYKTTSKNNENDCIQIKFHNQ